ncbi:PLxRFG domain-containing protein [Aeromonas enteropelogenes]|uniref:PLxRFG domain-containing protein n=1 Tax=Aeromonas enteropelogenes TaxID=29489 RepID=UPI0038D1CE95
MDKTTTMLPTAQQSDSRMDEFWDSLESGLASPVPPRNLDVGLSDVARATGAGGLELIGGIGELARQAGNYGRLNAGKDQGEYLQNVRASMANKLAPVMNVVAGIGELAQSGADSLKAGMSDDAKEALGRSLVSESPSGRTVWGEGAGDIDVWAMKMANGIGSLLPTLASGGITGLAAKATVGRMVTTSMMKRGVTQEVAELVASKTVSRLATGAAVTTGMTGSVGSAGTNARDAVLGMSFDELSNSTTFRDAFRRIDTDQRSAQFSDSEKLQLAREETANLASQATMGDAKTWGAAAVGTLMGDTMLFKMLAGKAVGGGMLRKVVKGAVGEGGSEAIEEGTQQLSVNEALSDVTGADLDPYQGVVPAALEGGLIGVGVGGAAGGIAGLRSDDVAAQDELGSEANQTEPAQPDSEEVAPEPAVEPEVKQSPLGPGNNQFDELRDVPAYLRQDDTAERFKGMAENSEVQEALAEAAAPTVDELLAQAKNQQPEGVAEPVPMGGEEVQVPVSPMAARIGPLNSLRVTKRGKPFASEKEALLASRKDMEVPVPLNGGGFGVADIAEVERVKADQPNVDQPQQLTPAVDTDYRDVLPSNEQLEVAHDQPAQISAIGGERQGDQLGAGQPAAEGAGPASTELASRTGSGDQRNLAPPVPVPTGLQRDDQTLTTPATDAGVAVSEATKPEPIPATTPWAEAIDNPDGTITLQGELPLIKQWARNNGVKVIPGKGGLIVAKLSAGKVRQFAAPSVSEQARQIEAARAEVAPAPTEAQKEAGNYKKGHITLQGLDIALENPKGSTRSGTDQNGHTWQSTLAHDYGYIKRTTGADGDQVDVFIGDQPDSETVFVVDQIDPRSGAFDEHKVMLGFADEAAARAGYLANYEKGWKGLGAIKAMSLDAFKQWLNDGGTTKPVSVGRSERQNKIADFGEKIGGARKDTWSAYRDTIEGATTEQIKALPLSKAWPAPDYDKLLEAGVDRDAVAIARAARDAIPAKPRVSYKVRNWAQAVELLRDLSLGLMDGAVDIDTAKQEMSNANLRSAHAIQNRAELYQAVGHRRSLADLELSVGSYSLYDGVKYDPPKQIWTIRRASRSNVFGGWPRTIASGSNKAEVIAEFKRQYDQLTQEVSKPRAISFDIYSRHGQGWIVGKKIGRNHLDLTEAFERASDARKYRDDHYDELISKLEKAKKIPHERRDINQPRVGEDMRGGANVTPALFGQAFGFRGVEFGNWVEQRRRQRDLNDAYDALMDMAAVLGISPKALSLNGELGLAFGARGSGGVSPAAAHYEPGKVVINLTKMKGAGSLGHEWWHALDSYFARMRDEPGGMMTEARDVSLAARESPFIHRGVVRREMIEAFGIVNRVIKQTALKERSRKLDDKRSKAYWTTDRELSARAFESYLIAKLQDQGASNDYLANIVSEAAWDAEASLGIRLDRSYPYPTAGEIPAIRSGFDQFFNTIEEREEGDRRILFSKQAIAEGVKPVKHLTRKEAELVTKEWFKRYQGAHGINVQIHSTQADLERALGLDTQPGLLRRAAFDGDTATLHVAADTIANPGRLREILRHEVLAHYGLANVLGGGEYTKLISRVIQSRTEPSMKAVWDWVSTHYADEEVGVQAEEIIAHLAELEQSAWRRGWDKVVSWVTQALRAVGFVPDGIKAAEVRSMIEALGRKLEGEGKVSSSDRDGQWFSAERTPWRPGFPEVILHGRLGDATSHPDYEAAKHGNYDAARRLVSEVLSPDAIRQIKNLIGKHNAIALGVHAEEEVSRNAIPGAMADVLGKLLGIDVDLDIVQAAQVGRTAQDGFGRLANQPDFDGSVRTDKPYLIMDDTLTQGGTLASLKGYIENRGGEVLAATALTGKQYSAKIAIDSATLEQLRDQYDGTDLEAWWHNRFGYGFDSLTESEARYLLRAQDADKIRDRVAAAGSASSARGEHESARDDGSLPPDGLKFSQSLAGQADTLANTLRDHHRYTPGSAIGAVNSWLKQRRPLMLGTLTDLQIDQVYRDITGGAVSEYQRLRTQMEADRNDILLDAETRIDPLWDALGKQDKADLSNLMHDATMARLHPDRSLDENSYYQEAKQKQARAKKPDTRATYEAELRIIERNHAELTKLYNALPANAKALYGTMLDTYTVQWNSLRGAIAQRLEDLLGVNQGRALAAEMRQKMEHALKHGPYFPLTRYGDYVVKARKGDEYVREHFERRADAEQAVKQYQRDGYNAVMTVKEEGSGDSANANQLGMEMLDFLDSADGVNKTALKDEIWQAMLRMMPDASYAKHAIHRRRVKGASRDAHRAYLNSVYHYARHVSKIRYGHKMQGVLDTLSEQIQAGVAGEPSSLKPEELEIAQQVLNEMNKRHDLNMNPTGKAWAGSAGNLGFFYYIGPSIASAVVNMTQNFTVILPQLGAKYGFAKSAAALTQALGDYVTHGKFKAGTTEAWHSLTRSTTLPADEQIMLNRLYRAGVLDLTQAHSIAAKADTDQQDVKPMGKHWRRAMRWVGATFHNAEVLNREVAALAAYRLLKQAEPTLNGQQYADRVAEMVYAGHGNYAASNRPRYMRNDIIKILTQFKIYSQMMTYVIYSNAIKAAKGDKVAAKTLGGILATHWVMAGVMGLPTPITAVAYALAAAFDDDDDRSGEASFRLALTEALGPRAGELLAKGPMDTLTNLSIAGRTGLGDLWWRSPKEGTEGDDLAWHAVQQLLGPVAGIGINLARGTGQIVDGHVQRGLETVLPKFIRDVAKAYRQATEGEQTLKGDLIMDDVSTWNVAMQALGFGSAKMAKHYDAREYIKGKEKRIADKRSQLLTDYYVARKSGDMDEVQEVLEGIKMFNAIHYPGERITGKSLALSFKAKLRSNERTQGGVYLNRNREYLRKEGHFVD